MDSFARSFLFAVHRKNSGAVDLNARSKGIYPLWSAFDFYNITHHDLYGAYKMAVAVTKAPQQNI